MNEHWAIEAAERIKEQRIEHRTYCRAVASIFNALSVAQPGEVVVVVGPSRVGKSRAVAQAVSNSVATPNASSRKPYIVVEAENASTLGSFSTKAFMQLTCRAIEHPIYGVAAPDDPWGSAIHTRLHRTPEAILRDAVEQGLILLGTRFVVVDEAHHVGYAGSSGRNALAVLDSWKCMAFRTGTVLCLVGSYKLLDILACAPHLLGRQRLIEFPRYRADSSEDVKEFGRILRVWSSLLRFEDRSLKLQSWSRLLFTHSLGCIGNLSKWLRSALGEVAAENTGALRHSVLLSTRHPASQEAAMVAEIEAGEAAMSRDNVTASCEATATPRKTSRTPFQRHTKRFEIGGRS